MIKDDCKKDGRLGTYMGGQQRKEISHHTTSTHFSLGKQSGIYKTLIYHQTFLFVYILKGAAQTTMQSQFPKHEIGKSEEISIREKAIHLRATHFTLGICLYE
jgi:hypothetical protein